MARTRNRRRELQEAQMKAVRSIEQFGLLLLCEAECWEEECTGLLLLQLAREERRKILRSGRYGHRGRYDAPKLEALLQHIIYDATERFFKAFLRMDREAFWDLHDHIRHNPIFESTWRRPQRPSHIQLATFLCYVGGETGIKTAAFCAIAEGTVWLYTHRCVHAIRCLRDDFISWPTVEERDNISEWMETHGFPGCIGSADGSYFPVARRPSRNGYAFYCHKGFYALVLQASCNPRGLITSYDHAWPGCVQDSRVFRLSHLWEHKEDYFRPHEYILVDKGYPLTQYSIRPFHDHDLTSNPEVARDRKTWNQRLSKLRVRIEHVFGRLKGRFPYLRYIPGSDVDDMYRIIEALLIVNNFLDLKNDDPTTIPGFNGAEDEDVDEVRLPHNSQGEEVHLEVSDDELHAMGVYRRKQLVDLMVNGD